MQSESKLKGVMPESIVKRLKMFVYGAPGSGKTFCALQFPRPYFIDTEKGAENDAYIEALKRSGGVLFQSRSFEDVFEEIKLLAVEKHPYKTLVIDPITVLYSNLVEKIEARLLSEPRMTREKLYGRHWTEANGQFKRLIDLLMKLDMNVIMTAHAKEKYGSDMTILGETFDAYKKLDYMFDLVIETKSIGPEKFGFIKKSRISSFAELERIPFSYDEIATRYGREILEKDAVPLGLVTEATLFMLRDSILKFMVDKDTVQKWLDRAIVDDLDQFTEEQAIKILNMLNKGA